MRGFVGAGGGYLGLGTGARFAAQRVVWGGAATERPLGLFQGDAVGPIDAVGQGLAPMVAREGGTLGAPLLTTYLPGAALFSPVPSGEPVAELWATATEAVGVVGLRFGYERGRGLLVSPAVTLEEAVERDWALWDNRFAAFDDPDSEWPWLGEQLAWVTGRPVGGPSEPPEPLTDCACPGRFALYSSHTAAGGAWPGLLPAVARSIQAAGHTPLAVRAEDIASGGLVTTTVGALVMPGGWAPGYIAQLSGQEQALRDFVYGGGGYVGISAGAFYAASTVGWAGESVPYPLGLYSGRLDGPLEAIAPWPARAETLIDFEPSPFAPAEPSLTALYWGEGAFTPPPETAQPTRTLGSYRVGGLPAVTSHWYGFGTVLYPNLHFEVEEGSTRDWLLWDEFAADGVTPLVDPETDWPFLAGLYDAVLPPRPAPGARGDGTRVATQWIGPKAPDSLGDAQRPDGVLPAPEVAVPADGWYTVAAGETLLLAGFGRAGQELGAGFVDLVLRYSVGLAYTGQRAVQISTDSGEHWSDTPVQPSATDLATDVTVPLGTLTPEQLAGLVLRFTNDSGRPAAVSFDTLRLRVRPWPRVYLPRALR